MCLKFLLNLLLILLNLKRNLLKNNLKGKSPRMIFEKMAKLEAKIRFLEIENEFLKKLKKK